MTENRHVPRNPYVGPRSFERGERLWGRDREVNELLDLIIAETVVLLFSPSGAGKSSLIRAGLIPRLEAQGFVIPPVMRVGREPADTAYQLRPINRYIVSSLSCLEEWLPPEEQSPLSELVAFGLGEYLDSWDARRKEPANTVLIFDQFEEILTLDPTDLDAKREFFAQVGAALRDRPRGALFAFREDYLAELTSYMRPLFRRLSAIYRLEPMGPQAALEAIRGPAQEAGVDFTDRAAQMLVSDLSVVRVQQPDGTVQLVRGPHIESVQIQVVARRLWETLPAGVSQITEADIQAVGDLDSSLSDFYASTVASVASQTSVPERRIREWFDRRLITEQGTRGLVLHGPEQSEGLDNRAIWPLVDAHLVRAERRRGTTWFELAHDRLIAPVRADNAAWFAAPLGFRWPWAKRKRDARRPK